MEKTRKGELYECRVKKQVRGERKKRRRSERRRRERREIRRLGKMTNMNVECGSRQKKRGRREG